MRSDLKHLYLNNDIYELIKEKDNGGLYPSADVVSVLSVLENVFKQFCTGDSQMSSCKSLRSKMKVCIMQELLTKNVFASLIQHNIDNHDPLGEDLHSTQLCKKIAHKYLDMRLFRYQQTFTDDVIHRNLQNPSSSVDCNRTRKTLSSYKPSVLSVKDFYIHGRNTYLTSWHKGHVLRYLIDTDVRWK